ncbi:MAG: LysR family transcriptional regulator [Paracoccaceae bacterium]
MDLRQLRYFLAIVEAGSFSRAAARLNVAQPALSIHVRNMEEALGTTLLVRHPGGVAPTEAGALLALRARRILDEFARIRDEVSSLGSEPRGDVRVGLPGTLSEILAVPLITAAQARFPRVRVQIAEAMSGFVLEWLRDQRIDLALLYEPPDEPGLESEPLLDEELVAVAPAGTFGKPDVALADMRGQRLILPTARHGLRKVIDQASGPSEPPLAPDIEIDSYANILNLVALGTGCSILPRHAVAAALQTFADLLESRDFTSAEFRRTVYIARNDGWTRSSAVAAIHDLLMETTAELAGDGRWIGAALKPV